MKKYLTLPNLALAICMFFLLYFQFKGVRMLLDQGWQALNFGYTLDYGEGPLLDQAVRLSNGEGIYPPDISTPPYTIANYPPSLSSCRCRSSGQLGRFYGMGA
jgi:hypothetical protein